MPRFDIEGFNPERRIDNDSRDRSVPIDENYYSDGTDELAPPERSGRQLSEEFSADVLRDFDRERRDKNEREAEIRRENRPKKNPKKKKKVSTSKSVPIIILALLLIIALIGSAMVNGILRKINYDDKVENQYVQSSELKSDRGVKNILLLGVDARKNQDTKTSHPDSMMLVSVDTKHKCIKMISFLRDSWVYIPSKGYNQRINTSAQENGYSGVVDAIEYNFGVDIDGYVVTDFEMFKAMVDSIGGVEIEVTEKEAKEVTNHKVRYGHVKLKAGKHVLTGKQALAYSRIRKIDTDFMRAKRQRTVINAILNEVKTNPIKLYKLANGSAPYLETDLSKGELKRLVLAAVPCLTKERTDARVPFDGTWQYANINGASVISVDTKKNKEMLIEYIYEKTAQEILAEEAEKEAK
ncbi:MAG: LCP family protein [Eubacterium sp.]|nr:LCP family protein [Eubacterium sp.]